MWTMLHCSTNIRNEAREYLRKKKFRGRYGLFSTIEGCVGLSTQCNSEMESYDQLFKCKLFWDLVENLIIMMR
jgi:hypothetical protein